MTISNIPAIAALFGLLISGAAADNYQPLPGSFRPPSLGGTSKAQSGFRQGNSQFITTPSQQQAWTSQPYGSSSHYYLPGQQSGPEYQQQNTPTDTWNRSFNINPGNTMNNMFGYGNNSSDNRAQYNYQQPAYQPPIQQPAYQPPIQQAPVYPQQYNYGSSYPQQYGYTAPPIQQSPTSPPRQPPQQPAPFSSRPFGGNSSHFRPPEL